MKTRYIAAFCCLFALAVEAQAQDLSQYKLSELETRYQAMLDQGNYKDAQPLAEALEKRGGQDLPAQDTAYAQVLYKAADLYEYLGDYPKALTCLQKAIDIQKNKIPKHADYARSLHLLGILNRNLGNYDKAETAFLQALELRKTTLGNKHPRYAATLFNLGMLCVDMGDYVRAENLQTQALELRREILGENHPEYAASLSNLGVLYYVMGDYEQAESFYNQALAVQKRMVGEKHPAYAAALNNLGMLYLQIGNYAKAEEIYLQVLNIQKQSQGEQHPAYAAALDNLSLVCKALGKYEQAQAYGNQALNLRKASLGEDHPEYAAGLNNLGNLFLELGDFAQAEHVFLRALNIKKINPGEKHPDYASALSNLANFYASRGDFSKAEGFYQQAAEIEKNAFGENHPNYALTLNGLASLYHELKSYDKSEETYSQVLQILKASLGETHADYLKVLNANGVLYRDMGYYSQALGVYNQVLNLQGKILGQEHPAYAKTLNNLANIYEEQGNYAQAQSAYSRVIALFKESLGDKHPDYAGACVNLANVFLKQQNTDMAWLHLLASIQSNTDLNLSRNINQAWADSLLAANCLSYKTLNSSLALLRELLQTAPQTEQQQVLVSELAMRLLEKQRGELSGEQDQLRLLTASNHWLHKALPLLRQETDAQRAFELAERNKSALVLDAVSGSKAQSFGLLPDSLAARERDLQKRLLQLKAALSEKRNAKERQEITTLLNETNLQFDELKKRIQAEHPRYAALRYHHPPVSLSEVQKLLADDHSALIEYTLTDTLLYIFYADKNRVFYHVSNFNADSLSAQIKMLHSALSHYERLVKDPEGARQDYITAALGLYNRLLTPVLQQAPESISNLVLIPDGELAHLPFETFLTERPADGTPYKNFAYLLKKYAIAYNYSATLWRENKAKSNRNNGRLLAMAADYQEVPGNTTEIRPVSYLRLRQELIPLPAARQEVQSLEDRYKGLFTYEKQAGEANFKRHASDYAVIHLALHGLLNRRDPLLSALAFTEDGDSMENNFLQAYEISKMELNADLVVLSACETGFGEFQQGNGTASLARAFMYAGIPSIVVSLWEVNDVSTGKLMGMFYEYLAAGKSKDQALRQAKLDYLASAKGLSEHPAYWSPFIFIGNEAPVSLQSKGGFAYWWVLGGAGALLALLLVVRRGRGKEA